MLTNPRFQIPCPSHELQPESSFKQASPSYRVGLDWSLSQQSRKCLHSSGKIHKYFLWHWLVVWEQVILSTQVSLPGGCCGQKYCCQSWSTKVSRIAMLTGGRGVKGQPFKISENKFNVNSKSSQTLSEFHITDLWHQLSTHNLGFEDVQQPWEMCVLAGHLAQVNHLEVGAHARALALPHVHPAPLVVDLHKQGHLTAKQECLRLLKCPAVLWALNLAEYSSIISK